MKSVKKTSSRSVAGRTSALLRNLADLVEKSTVNEINALLQGKSELRIVEIESTSHRKDSKNHQAELKFTYSEIVENLNSLTTREVGRDLLVSVFPTKTSLEKFVRFLDLPVNRTDSLDNLLDKIVESEIGARLRSSAVQGKQVI